MNNGFTTGPFLLGRGVRRGDPLSPHLFIKALETLAIKIREDCNVQGLKIGDDMTRVLKDETSYTNLFRILNYFGECSGFKVNDEITDIMPLGDNILQEKDSQLLVFVKT